MPRFLLLLLLLPVTCPAQERDPDDGTEPPATQQEAANAKYECEMAQSPAELMHASAQASLAYLGAGTASSDFGSETTIRAQWDVWEDEGFSVPQWAETELDRLTIIVKGELADDLTFQASGGNPNGTYSTFHLILAQTKHAEADRHYASGAWDNAYHAYWEACGFYYRSEYGETIEIDGVEYQTGGSSRVYADAEQAIAEMYAVEYAVADAYMYGY